MIRDIKYPRLLNFHFPLSRHLGTDQGLLTEGDDFFNVKKGDEEEIFSETKGLLVPVIKSGATFFICLKDSKIMTKINILVHKVDFIQHFRFSKGNSLDYEKYRTDKKG